MANVKPSPEVETAYANTDPRYHAHIELIKGKPYMKVSGRIAMANDEHTAQGAQIHFGHPVLIEHAGHSVCQVCVTSDIRGSSTGIAEINFSSRNPAEQAKPFECAQTHAIGRALGYWGYGNLSGPASYEEVLSAQDNQIATSSTLITAFDDIMDATPVKTVANENGHAPIMIDDPCTDKQFGYLKGLLHQRGAAKDNVSALIALVYGEETRPTKSQAHADIEELKASDVLPYRYLSAYLGHLKTHRGLTKAAVREYIKNTFDKDSASELERAEQDSLIAWLSFDASENLPEENLDEEDTDPDDNKLELALERIGEVGEVSRAAAMKYLNGAFVKHWSMAKRIDQVLAATEDNLTADINSFARAKK